MGLVLLDHQGKVVHRQVVGTLFSYPADFGVADLMGDGKDAFLLASMAGMETKIQAIRDAGKQVMWEWSVPGEREVATTTMTRGKDGQVVQSVGRSRVGGTGIVMGIIRPPAGGSPPIVLVRATPNVIYGLDGRQGKPVWKGRGLEGDARERVGDQPVFGSLLLGTSDPSGTPRIVGHQHQATVCRLVQSLRPDAEPIDDLAVPAIATRGEDPRLVRSLPWSVDIHSPMLLGLLFLVPGPLLVLLWIWLLRTAVNRRSIAYGLAAAILSVTVVLAWFVLRRFLGQMNPAEILLGGLPAVIVIVALTRSLRRRKWTRAGGILVSSTVLSLALCGFLLYRDWSQLDADQHYSWAQWSWLWMSWVPGAYFTGCLLLLVYLGVTAFRGCRLIARSLARGRGLP
jgi:hypothetical protein